MAPSYAGASASLWEGKIYGLKPQSKIALFCGQLQAVYDCGMINIVTLLVHLLLIPK